MHGKVGLTPGELLGSVTAGPAHERLMPRTVVAPSRRAHGTEGGTRLTASTQGCIGRPAVRRAVHAARSGVSVVPTGRQPHRCHATALSGATERRVAAVTPVYTM